MSLSSKSAGYANGAFEYSVDDKRNSCELESKRHSNSTDTSTSVGSGVPNVLDTEGDQQPQRENWGNPAEFLLSCISMSVGLGNIWRFPYVAYANGGGAFLIPYLIVLFFIGRPLYFLEMILGQFSSAGSVKVWEVVPIVKGIGYGQALATWYVVTYYCVLMALAFFYLFSSFQAVLPWTVCKAEWSTNETACYNSSGNLTGLDITNTSKSSAELFFYKDVLKLAENFDDGLGLPEWRLSLCLLLCWILIFATLAKGVSSSGKVAYFTALFPYAVLITLLIRGVTLPGASEGILYFVTPQWEKIATAEVWYAAVTQCFFSLSVGFGPIITFSSYNPFRHPVYRDSTIVSLADTGTSILAGITIFSILGNLAYESGKPIEEVVKGGTGLAFISYPEAISKFDAVPQLFAVLFFLMLITLAIGSAAGLTSCVITILCDDFPSVKRWIITAVVSVVSFFIGLIYVTPAGPYVLDLVDYFGGGFIIYVLVIVQTIALCWIYGLHKILRDVRFMLDFGLGIYWKYTWCIFIPIALLVIFIYAMVSYMPMRTGDGQVYPSGVSAIGWILAAIAILQIPCWGIYVVYKQKSTIMDAQMLGLSNINSSSSWARLEKRRKYLVDKFWISLRPSLEWGPKDPELKRRWIEYCKIPKSFNWKLFLPHPKIPVWMKKR
uniref:Transporter n=1 Tax=Daphnia magna TaxID=35525 RepID=A0A0P5K3J4_9CRUS